MLKEKKARRTMLAIVVSVACLTMSANADFINIGSLALYSEKSVEFGNDVTVDGSTGALGYVSLGSGTNTGDIFSLGNIYVGNNSQVTGNLWANRNMNIGNKAVVDGNINVVGDYWKSNNAKVTGTAYHGQEATIIDLPKMGPEPDGGTVGSSSIWKNRKTTTTLDPGSYNDFGFGRDATLNLSSGTYTLDNFWMDKGGLVNVDTSLGDVILNIHGGLTAGNDVAFETIGDGKLFVNVFDKDVYLGNDTKLDGIVRVYNGGFSTGNGAELYGSVQASDRIWLGNESKVTYVVSDPQTILLLMTGGGMCLVWHRRKRVLFQ